MSEQRQDQTTAAVKIWQELRLINPFAALRIHCSLVIRVQVEGLNFLVHNSRWEVNEERHQWLGTAKRSLKWYKEAINTWADKKEHGQDIIAGKNCS